VTKLGKPDKMNIIVTALLWTREFFTCVVLILVGKLRFPYDSVPI